MVAAKKDIAFVDFADEASSTLAKDGLNGHKFTPGGEPMKVSNPVSFTCYRLVPMLTLDFPFPRLPSPACERRGRRGLGGERVICMLYPVS